MILADESQARTILLPPTRSAALALALTWAGMAQRVDDLRAAALVYGAAFDSPGPSALSARHQLAGAQALMLTGGGDRVRSALSELTALPEPHRWSLETDLENPYLGASEHADDAWQRLLSQPFVQTGLEPLALTAGPEEEAFDRLSAVSSADAASDALISVVVPVFRPDLGLITSVRSLLAQTWHDLEVIVVDDGSGAAYAGILESVAALDTRVAVVRLAVNGGTYRAFNAGIRASHGELVAFQGSDDWSHPRRLERQVGALRAASAPASQSDAVRARPDLSLQWFGYSPVRRNASSLLVRAEVIERLGPFLEVRKAADSEYLMRIARFSGEIVHVAEVLAVIRLGAGSLSRADFGFAWHSPQRIDFRQSFHAWTQTLDRQDPPLPISAVPVFDPPLSYLPDPNAAPTRITAPVLLGDFSADPTDLGRSPQTALLWDELADGAAALWHLQSPSHATSRRALMHHKWYERVVTTPRLRTLTRLDPIAVPEVCVLDPRLLTVTDAQDCHVRADSVTVLADPDLLDLDDPDGVYLDVLGVADACAAWWGRRPTWRLAPWCSPADAERVRSAFPGLVQEEPTGAEAVPSLRA